MATKTTRLTISLAGKAYAVRTVAKDADSGAVITQNIHHLITDHMGSTQATVHYNSGTVVPGSIARYMPFGDYRTTPTADDTDMGFTGHMENNYIKLVYMNACWYAPGLGRFLSLLQSGLPENLRSGAVFMKT